MKSRSYTLKAIIVSTLYWFADSAIHRFIFAEGEYEIIPSEINELWMRIVIVLLLICFGIFADRNTKLLLIKEKEKRIVFNASVSATQHILNNLINQMQLFKIIADESNAFDNETIHLYEQAMMEGQELVKKLTSVDDLTELAIERSVSPQLKQ